MTSETLRRPHSFHFDIGKLDLRKALLLGGAAATALYVGIDAVAALRYEGYSYIDQTISELSAIDAPTRSLWIPFGVVHSLLTIGCGAGVWMSARGSRRLKLVGGFITVIGLLGLVAWPFAPMHQREVLAADGGTLSDTVHLILGGVDSLLFVSSIAVGATIFGKRFRNYSMATIAALFVCGLYTAMNANAVSQDEATPWIGITERISVFGSMIWIAVFALLLLPRRSSGSE